MAFMGLISSTIHGGIYTQPLTFARKCEVEVFWVIGVFFESKAQSSERLGFYL
jgi:hypothetical protein